MSQSYQSPRFLNYPPARKGPEIPYAIERRPNPTLRGPFLVIAAFLMEWIRFIRETAWRNAGFASLRNIRDIIDDYEPRYEPTVTPLPVTLQEAKVAQNLREELLSSLAKASALNSNPTDGHVKYYSVHDYRALYLSGEITPTDVVHAILPLIRRDTTPPGRHSVAWLEIKIDRILKAAEASTLRYKNKQSLGLLDGVPTAVKDEYDIDGYATTLGSTKNYADDVTEAYLLIWISMAIWISILIST